MTAFLLCPSVSLVRFRHQITPLRYADKRILNIIKVYIERNNLEVELTGDVLCGLVGSAAFTRC